jgi:hypothetical protein
LLDPLDKKKLKKNYSKKNVSILINL